MRVTPVEYTPVAQLVSPGTLEASLTPVQKAPRRISDRLRGRDGSTNLGE